MSATSVPRHADLELEDRPQSSSRIRFGNRRPWGVVVLAVGCFFLVAAVLLPLYVYPRVAVLPDDPQNGSTLTATGATILVPDAKSPSGARVVQNADVTIKVFVSEAAAPIGDSVVWQFANRTLVNGTDLASAQVERFSLNRKTAQPTNCCGDRLITDEGDAQGTPLLHEGFIVWPFNVQKQSYPLWDVTLKKSRTANYVGTTTYDGIKAYKFSSTVPLQTIGTMDLPGGFFGLKTPSVTAISQYSDTMTYWIEPASGAVLSTQDETNHQFVYAGKTVTAFAGNLKQEDFDASQLATFRQGAFLLPLIRGGWAMWLLGWVGLVLAAIGAWMVARSAHREELPRS